MRYLLINLLIILPILSFAQQDSFPELKGPYLGQKPPGLKAEIFAPGIISGCHNERSFSICKNGQELYYGLQGQPYSTVIFMQKKENGWSKPITTPFSDEYFGDFTVSSDGNIIVFSSNRPIYPDNEKNYYCWYVKKIESGWSDPVPFDTIINIRESFAGCPTIADNGNLYFFTDRKGGEGNEDIWVSKFVNGKYQSPENLGKNINSTDYELDPFVNPEEKYLIFTKIDKNRDEGADLYISFKDKDGNWTKAINMGEKVNSDAWEFCPTVSSDGKYLFFTSNRIIPTKILNKPISYEEKQKIINSLGNGSEDIYWIDSKIIDNLK